MRQLAKHEILVVLTCLDSALEDEGADVATINELILAFREELKSLDVTTDRLGKAIFGDVEWEKLKKEEKEE